MLGHTGSQKYVRFGTFILQLGKMKTLFQLFQAGDNFDVLVNVHYALGKHTTGNMQDVILIRDKGKRCAQEADYLVH